MKKTLNSLGIAFSLLMVLLSMGIVTVHCEQAIDSFRRALVAEAIRPEGFARFVADDRFAVTKYEMRGGLRGSDPVDDPREIARAILPYQFSRWNYTQAIAWGTMAVLLIIMRVSRMPGVGLGGGRWRATAPPAATTSPG